MPRHIRNILIALLLATLAVVAGINGYVHHQFKTNIDKSLTMMQPFARVKYSELSTSILSGEVELKNLRVSSSFLPETLNLGNLTFETPGFAYMLNGPEKLKQGEFPNHLGFAINDFYFDLHSETAEWLERLVKRLQPIYAEGRTICGGKSLFAPSDYKAMTYTRLHSSLRVAYKFNENKQKLTFNLSAHTRNVAEVIASVTFTGVKSMSVAGLIPTAGEGAQKLTNVEINYQDKTYAPRVIKYCAELDKSSKETYIDAEIKQPDEYFYKSWGFAPGLGLREAYKDFLLKPDLVTLTMTPGEDFQPIQMVTLDREALMEALNVSLKINGLDIADLSFKLPSAKFKKQFDQQLADNLNFESLLRGEPIKAPQSIKKKKVLTKLPAKYHKINIKSIPKHLGDYIKVTTKTGHTRKGRLLKFDEINIYVEKKASGGKFTMTVPRNKIKNVEAYYSKKVYK
ncbi:MAG: hypothetical protein QM484_01365 [Woeseiaceae bacterium]